MNKLLQEKIRKIKPVSIYYTLPPICDCKLNMLTPNKQTNIFMEILKNERKYYIMLTRSTEKPLNDFRSEQHSSLRL